MPVHECIEAWKELREESLLIAKVILTITQLPEDVRRRDVFHQQVPRISDEPLSVYLIPLGEEGLNIGTIVQIVRPGPSETFTTALAAAITSWLYFKGYRRTAVLVTDERGHGMQFIHTSDTDVKCTPVIAHALGSARGVSN